MLPVAIAAALLATTLTAHAPQPDHRAAAHDDHRTARSVLRDMSLAQRVGQLFMVGTPADELDRATRAQIGRFHVGNVMLTGRSYDGLDAPTRVTRAMRAEVSAASTSGVRLFVATDQEGGLVQVLQGPGFADDAVRAGAGQVAAGRCCAARPRDGPASCASVGVNLNLAPVLDTVPSREPAKHNPPIGKYDREFGFTAPAGRPARPGLPQRDARRRRRTRDQALPRPRPGPGQHRHRRRGDRPGDPSP